MKMVDNGLIEITKKLLFEQAKSAMTSFDSAQDSLDKAYLTIMFGNIAFYATKIKPFVDNMYSDLASMVYMALALIFILCSFMLSKSAMKLLYDNTLLQIELLVSDTLTEIKIDTNTQNLLKIDKLNGFIEQLNWQIPIMVFFSSGLCFLKVSFQQIFQILLIKYFCGIWLISVIIAFSYVRMKQNGKALCK
ncbi:MAG: hypothetical protein KBD37_03455 [Burkholderiales bacterium]|nr:hypothetical protein [Burkholderiales bacterium]